MEKYTGHWAPYTVRQHFAGDYLVTIRRGLDVIQGTTGFFREDVIIQDLLGFLMTQSEGSVRSILIAPCSVGCQVFSTAIRATQMGLFERFPDLKIYGLDNNPDFIEIAREGKFPLIFADSIALAPDARNYFQQHRDHYEVSPDIRDRVIFLPPQDLESHVPEHGRYTLSFSTNLFEHLFSPKKENILASLLSISEYTCFNDLNYFRDEEMHHVFSTLARYGSIHSINPRLRQITGQMSSEMGGWRVKDLAEISLRGTLTLAYRPA